MRNEQVAFQENLPKAVAARIIYKNLQISEENNFLAIRGTCLGAILVYNEDRFSHVE